MPARSMAGRFLTLALLTVACGPSQSRVTGRPQAANGWLPGQWRWSFVSVERGVRRIETEDWSLAATGREIHGWYRRQVDFVALDGVPFHCSQSPRYRLVTRYSVHGGLDGDGAWIQESGYTTEPSPCESGHRGTARYRATPREDGVELAWSGGRQRLRRPTAPTPRRRAARTAAGDWSWRNRRELLRGEVRTEVESWHLREAPGGALSGSYERRVTVSAEDGRPYRCSQRPSYEVVDRFDVTGWRDGDRIQIGETAAHPDPGRCAGDPRRHLDSAGGAYLGDAIELEWRGGNRQVLERVAR